MITTAPYAAAEPPSVDGTLEEIVPLVGFVAVAGPPALVALGALVFGALTLAGPFAVAVSLVVAMAVVAVSVAVLVTAIVSRPPARAARVRRTR